MQHLIHIGYPKAGSTFLQEWFRQHPQMFYSPGGLGGFYNVYQISQRAATMLPGENESFLYFVTSSEALATPKPSTGTIPVETGIPKAAGASPTAKPAQEEVCRTLKNFFPQAKILMVTRGFKAILLSGYSQFIKSGGILIPQTDREAKHFAIPEWEAEHDNEELDYTFMANLYEEAFGRENVIILPYELLREDQNKFLAIIEKHLGLRHFKAEIGRLNESLSPQELYWYPRISSIVSRFSRCFGEKRHARIYRWYVSKTLYNKFSGMIKILSRLKPDGAVTEADFPLQMLNYYRRNNDRRFAARFRNEPLYQPYLADYLLDE